MRCHKYSRSFGSIDRVDRWAVWRVLASLLPQTTLPQATPAQTCHNDGRRSWHHVPQPQQKHTVRPLSSRQNSEPRCRLVLFGSPSHRHRQRRPDMRLARREQASTAPRSWRSRERDLAICFWSVRLREPGRNKQSRTPRPTQRRVHGSQLDMYRWL